MNILIIAYYYPPISSGGTMRPLQMGKNLPLFGHEVTVLTQTYGRSKTEPGNPRIIRVHDIGHNRDRVGIRRKAQWFVLRAYTELLNKLGVYHSIYTWWKRKVMKRSDMIIEQVKPDVIIATYPPVEVLEIGEYFSRKYNIPLVSDFRDGLIFEPIETKRMNRYRCIREKYLEIEKRVLSVSSAVTSIAQPITDYYKEVYHPRVVEVISNAFDPGDLNDLPDDIHFDRECFNIVFTGRFSLSEESNRVDYFFDAVRNVIKRDEELGKTIRIHLVGEYRDDELKELKDLIEAGVIVLHGFVERRRALAYQGAADLLLIITLPDRRSSTSAKVFEYLYAGKPILSLTYKTALEDIITETKSGWNVHPQKVGEIAGLLWKIIREPGFYESIKPDRERIEEYSITTQMKKLDFLLSGMVNGDGSKKCISTLL